MFFRIENDINWDKVPRVNTKTLALDANLVFCTHERGEDRDNYIYVFKTEYDNLFYYTTSAFAHNNPTVQLSALIIDSNDRMYYKHFNDKSCGHMSETHKLAERFGWRRMENAKREWKPVLSLFLDNKVNRLLRE